MGVGGTNVGGKGEGGVRFKATVPGSLEKNTRNTHFKSRNMCSHLDLSTSTLSVSLCVCVCASSHSSMFM